jgi:hypothetical protein
MHDIHAMLASHLEDTFCSFLDEGKLAPADAAVQVQREQRAQLLHSQSSGTPGQGLLGLGWSLIGRRWQFQ